MSDTRLKTRKTIVADEVFAVANNLANERYFIVKAIARNQALNAGECVWQAQAGFETEFGPIQTGDSAIKIWEHVPVTLGSSFEKRTYKTFLVYVDNIVARNVIISRALAKI